MPEKEFYRQAGIINRLPDTFIKNAFGCISG